MKRFYSILFVLLALQVIPILPTYAHLAPQQGESECRATLGVQEANTSAAHDIYPAHASLATRLKAVQESIESGEINFFDSLNSMKVVLQDLPHRHALFLEAFVRKFEGHWSAVPNWVKEESQSLFKEQDATWIVRQTKTPKEFVNNVKDIFRYHSYLYETRAKQAWLERALKEERFDDSLLELVSYAQDNKTKFHLAQLYLEKVESNYSVRSLADLLSKGVGIPHEDALTMAVQSDLSSASYALIAEPGNLSDLKNFDEALYKLNGINPNYILTPELQWLRKLNMPDVDVWNDLMRVKAQIEYRAGKYKFYADPLEVLSIGSGLPYEMLKSFDLSGPLVRMAFYQIILAEIGEKGFQSMRSWANQPLSGFIRGVLLDRLLRSSNEDSHLRKVRVDEESLSKSFQELSNALVEDLQADRIDIFESPETLNAVMFIFRGERSVLREALLKTFDGDRRVPWWVFRHPLVDLNESDINWLAERTKYLKEFNEAFAFTPFSRAVARVWIKRELAKESPDPAIFDHFRDVNFESVRKHMAQLYLEKRFGGDGSQIYVDHLSRVSSLPQCDSTVLVARSNLLDASVWLAGLPKPTNIVEFEVSLLKLADLKENVISKADVEWLRKVDVRDIYVWNELMRTKAKVEYRTGENKSYSDPLELLSLGSGISLDVLKSFNLSNRHFRTAFYQTIVYRISDEGYRSMQDWTKKTLEHQIEQFRAGR